MGGRGASSGVSNKGIKYGKEYHTILEHDNIKFIQYDLSKSSTAPMETRTPGRIYVNVNKENVLKSIIPFKTKERSKQIDLDHAHKINGKWEKPHVHMGYFHNEYGDRKLTKDEVKLVENVKKIWENYRRK